MERTEEIRARNPAAYSEYLDIRAKILDLMGRADELAACLRRCNN